MAMTTDHNGCAIFVLRQATELANVVSAKGGAQRLLSVLDTNVALNQLDFLESQAAVLGVVLILQVCIFSTVIRQWRRESHRHLHHHG